MPLTPTPAPEMRFLRFSESLGGQPKPKERRQKRKRSAPRTSLPILDGTTQTTVFVGLDSHSGLKAALELAFYFISRFTDPFCPASFSSTEFS